MGTQPNLHVLFLGNYEADQQESMRQFADALFRMVSVRNISVDLIRPEARLCRMRESNKGLAKWLGYCDKYLLFPGELRRKIASLSLTKGFVTHICDHSNAVYTRWLLSVPHLVTCNDLLAVRSARGEIPENPTRWTGRQLQRFILQGLNRARHVTCISDATRRDLQRLSTLTSGQIDRIYMGLNYDYRPIEKGEAYVTVQSLGKKAGIDFANKRFVFHVGGNQWYKNRLGLLRIYNILAAQHSEVPVLVMAGQPFSAEMNEFVKERHLEGRVISLIRPSSEELRALYSIAEIMIFPSLQEGFGWPIIEAQACGCRVLTSNRAPMTEAGGDAAFYLDPQNAETAAAMIWHALNENSGERAARIDAGLRHADRFSAELMTDNYCARYEELAGRKQA
jgi:glycosyltransferase involved in cell wall biosynthesis